MLDLNFSLFFISFLIMILAFFLKRIFFRPIGEIVEAREVKSADATRTLGDILSRIQANTEALEAKLHKAKREAQQIKEELVQQGEALRRRMAEQARQQSQLLYSEKMAELDRQIQASAGELEQQVALFATQIKESIL